MEGVSHHGQSATVVFRLFVGASHAGTIIGKEGSNIKALREETRARIRISTPANRGEDRVVCISSRDAPQPGELNPAEAAFLRIYPQALDSQEGAGDDAPCTLRLLVAASQAGALIGRGGAVIKALRETSGANIRINEGTGNTPLPNDRICLIMGKVANVQSAVTSIITLLNSNPAHESLEDLEGPQAGGQPQHGQYGQHGQHGQGMAAAAAAAAAFAAQQTASLMSPGGMQGMQGMHGMQGMPGMPGMPGFSGSSIGGVPVVSLGMTAGSGGAGGGTVRSEMRVPSMAVGAIIGKGGTTINNIRQLSGATIKVQTSEPGAVDRAVEISGGASQVATAQSLIQACLQQSGGRY